MSRPSCQDKSYGCLPCETGLLVRSVRGKQCVGPGYAIIYAGAGRGGSIEPQGMVEVTSGNSQTFTITPDKNRDVADVEVDGVSVGPVTSYTFNNVTEPHEIIVKFVGFSWPMLLPAIINNAR